MRQWTAQVLLGHGNESLAWEGGHIHHATAQDHRIGIEQINAGGNGPCRGVKQTLDERGVFRMDEKIAQWVISGLLFVPAS